MLSGKEIQATETSQNAQKVLMSLFTIFRHLRPSGIRNFGLGGEPPAPRHVMALFHLAINGPMSVSELANNLGVTLTTASLSVTQMATSELVIRKEDPSDHRRTIVSVSPNIEPIIKEVFTTKVQALEKGLAVLGPKRSEAFLRDLELLLEAIEAQGETESNDHSNHKDTDVEPV